MGYFKYFVCVYFTYLFYVFYLFVEWDTLNVMDISDISECQMSGWVLGRNLELKFYPFCREGCTQCVYK